MIVSSTELQNNFGKYLMLAAKEDIIITRNGTIIARLSAVGGTVPGADAEAVAENPTKGSYYGGQRASYREYLELTKDSEDRYEYIDGEIYYLASPKTVHQLALAELFGIFYNWFRDKDCRPLVAPYDITLMRHAEDINVVQPDIMVICDLEEGVGEDGYYKGVPALVVEILSEGTCGKDMVKKLDLYMSCGVKEYWLVNPLNGEITLYRFEAKNISDSITFRKPEEARSFIFPGLAADLTQIMG